MTVVTNVHLSTAEVHKKRHTNGIKKGNPEAPRVGSFVTCFLVLFSVFLTCLFVLTEAYRGGGAV